MNQLHKTQLSILQKLLFSETLRYTDMKPDKLMGNNQFQFHLNQLTDEYKYVEKSGIEYRLTSVGKEYANRIDNEKIKIEKQAKISVWVACTRILKDRLQLLIGTRLKQPFFGCQGFISGKVKYGETVKNAALRELMEETNLEAKKITIAAMVHFRVFDSKTKELLEDKFMHLCIANNPKGSLKSNNEVKLEWVNQKDLSDYTTNPYEDKNEFLELVSCVTGFKGHPMFVETNHFTDKF